MAARSPLRELINLLALAAVLCALAGIGPACVWDKL